MHTSGTTGAPKGVLLLSHEAFCRQVRAIASLFPIGGDDRASSVLLLHHGFEFSAGFPPAALRRRDGHLPARDDRRGGARRPRRRQLTAMIGVLALFDARQRKVRRQARAAPAPSGPTRRR
ncbi:MAG: AMP-binding protein [Planctomycetota bacterium]|nr:AMP-binding protein [Planctomycetota bacterium]